MYLDNSLEFYLIFSQQIKALYLSYRLYGYSKGSEFVQRYLLFSNDTRVDKVAMANSGFYTFVDDQIDFPLGLKT